MFDKLSIRIPDSVNHHHNHTSHVTVNEHRAPTDDSIRIAKEIEEKILNSILGQVAVGDNKFQCHVFFFKDASDPCMLTTVRAVWSLNGIPHVSEAKQEPLDEMRHADLFAILAQRLIKNMGHDLACEFLKVVEASVWTNLATSLKR